MPNELIRGSYGSYNLDSDSEDATADLAALDSRLDTAESDIDALQAADVSLDSRLDTAEASITTLQSTDTALDTRIDVLETYRIAAAAAFHVDPVSGSDSNPGTLAAPFLTPGKALSAGVPFLGTSSGAVQILLHPGTYGTVTLSLPSGYTPPPAATLAAVPPLSIEGWASVANRNTTADERFTVITGPFTASAGTKAAGDGLHVKYTLTGASFTVDAHAGVGRMARVFRSGTLVFHGDIGENGTNYVVCAHSGSAGFSPASGDDVYIVEYATKFTALNGIGSLGYPVYIANLAATGQGSTWRCVGDQVYFGPTCWGTKTGGGFGLVLEGPCTYRVDSSLAWIQTNLGWTSTEQTVARHKGIQCNSNNSFSAVFVGQTGRKSLTTLTVNEPWTTWGTITQSIGTGIVKQVLGGHHRRFKWTANQASVVVNSNDQSLLGGTNCSHVVQSDGAGTPALDWNDVEFFSEIPFGWTFFLRGSWAGPFADYYGNCARVNTGMLVGPNTQTLTSGLVHRLRDNADAVLVPNLFGLVLPAAGAGSVDVEVGDSSLQLSLSALSTAGVAFNMNDGSCAHPARSFGTGPAGAVLRAPNLGSDATGDIYYRTSTARLARVAIGGTDPNVRLGVSSGLPAYVNPYTATISPSALGANQNDWAPTGFSTALVVRMDASTPVDITGLAGGAAGRTVHLVHVGTTALNTITLKHENASSTAANRFSLPNATDIIVPIGGSVFLWYDSTSSRWRALVAS